MKIKQEDGTELEVFSQEEADALAKKKAEEAAETAAQAERDKAQAEKADLEDQLKKLQDKEFNFNQLRNKNNKDSEEVVALKARLDEITGKVSKLETQPFERAKTDFMSANGIEGDKELKEKFNFFFEPLASKAKDESSYKAALAGAFAAATGGTKQPSFEGMMVSTRITPPSSGGRGAISEVGKAMGAAMGITDKDRSERKTHFGHAKK